MFVVNTSAYAPTFKNWASRAANLPQTHTDASSALVSAAVDHVVAVNSSLVLAFSNDFGRSIARFNVLAGGDVTVGTPIAVTGDDAWISTIIVVPGATPKFFYTTAPESRTGNFGVATFNADWTAVSTRRVALNGAFHHGAYEPITGKVYTWSQRSVNQHNVDTGALEYTRDVTALARATSPSTGNNHNLDGGKADGQGRLMMVVNSGRMIWIDLRGASLATTTKLGYTVVMNKDGLDDMTNIYCPCGSGGSGTPAPAPTNAPTLAPTRFVGCDGYTCAAPGWTPITAVSARNIACLAGVCTDRVCCKPPSCATAGVTCPTGKVNAGTAVQCRGQTAAGCDASLCCRTAPSA